MGMHLGILKFIRFCILIITISSSSYTWASSQLCQEQWQAKIPFYIEHHPLRMQFFALFQQIELELTQHPSFGEKLNANDFQILQQSFLEELVLSSKDFNQLKQSLKMRTKFFVQRSIAQIIIPHLVKDYKTQLYGPLQNERAKLLHSQSTAGSAGASTTSQRDFYFSQQRLQKLNESILRFESKITAYENSLYKQFALLESSILQNIEAYQKP